MNKKLMIPAVLASLCLLLAVFLQIVDSSCFDRSFFARQYELAGSAQQIGVSDEDLMKMTDVLLDYLKDERQDISVQAEVHGQMREIFDQREKDHMVDVKALYQTAVTVKNVSALLAVILFVFVIYSARKDAFAVLWKGYLWALLLFAAVFAALGAYALIDFDRFWTTFHQVLFDNDLWLLDPNTEIMINMVPSSFFSALVYRILGWLFASFVLIGAVLYGGKRWLK
ncbi:MAG: TIGR01906 family membrane protein [Erysipelotrichaceae bacterium]|nr:TIGR01906 family membrane protein [Erysipelotrichaceae bacterium]